MSHKQLFDYINEYYGLRGLFISELAGNLGISYKHANILTIKAGYKGRKKQKMLPLLIFPVIKMYNILRVKFKGDRI